MSENLVNISGQLTKDQCALLVDILEDFEDRVNTSDDDFAEAFNCSSPHALKRKARSISRALTFTPKEHEKQKIN